MLSQSLEGKRVKIICTDGEEFEGIVSDYIFPDDNEPEGIAAIDIEVVHRDLDCVSASMKMKSSQLRYWGRP